MTRHNWKQTSEAFRRIAAKRGIRNVAPDVPANPTTIYRIIKGETSEPHPATRAGIERIVEKHEQDKKQ